MGEKWDPDLTRSWMCSLLWVKLWWEKILIISERPVFWISQWLRKLPECVFGRKKKTLEEEIYFLKERFQDEAVFFGPRKVCAYHGFQRKHHTCNFFMFSEFSDPFHGLGNLWYTSSFFPIWLIHFFKYLFFFGARIDMANFLLLLCV